MEICYLRFHEFPLHRDIVPLAKSNYNIDIDYQPKEFTNKIIEENYDQHFSCPKLVQLMSSNDKLLCEKAPSALQYHVPNINSYTEDYYYHMLILF